MNKIQEREHYVISNLVALAGGDSRGYFEMGAAHCNLMLNLYVGQPRCIEFSGPKKLPRRLARFMEREDCVSFCSTLCTLLVRGARGLITLRVGRKMALGLVACLDRDLREQCGLGGDDE